MITVRYLLFLCLISSLGGCASTREFSDIHLHYTWKHAEIMEAVEAVDILRAHDVVLATVSGEPTDLALRLSQAGGDWIIPFASPYYQAGNRHSWFFDKKLLAEMRKRLETGQYGGIGEIHITSGVGPARDSKVFLGLMDLAREFKLPVLLHTNAGNYRYFESICTQHADLRFIWAHAGGDLQPRQLNPLMESCPNVWLDMTARDPWHYDQMVDKDGLLLPGWRDLFIKYQDRAMTGTDPVWNAHQTYRWYESDEGWSHYEKLINFHRNWLKQLPPEVEKKIRLTNAQKFFANSGRTL